MNLRSDNKYLDLWRMTILWLLNVFFYQFVDGIPWEHSTELFKEEGDNCKIKSGEPGICKLIEDCEPYYEGLRKKTIEYEFLVRCTLLNFSEVICCPTGEKSNNNVDPATSKPLELVNDPKANNNTVDEVKLIGDPITTRPTGTLPSTQPPPTEQEDVERPSVKACNAYKKLNPAGLTSLILEGEPVAPGAFPHMGGLIFNENYGDIELRCGASLISNRYVLTAAHCVYNPNSQPTVVRFGVVVWNAVVDDIRPVDVAIENVTLHPLYRSPLHYHDIALLRLAKDVNFKTFIFPACLHNDVQDLSSTSTLSVIGWGHTNTGTRARSDILLMTNVTTVPLDSCNATHMRVNKRTPERDQLNSGQYCAFDPEKPNDSCGADSGGPLQIGQKVPATLIGIVSYGHSCGTRIPSVYVRVAYYLEWIEKIVWGS